MRNTILIICRLAVVLSATTTAIADDAADFEEAWNRRRHAARYIRCKVDAVRVIPAGRIKQDPMFPAEDKTVDHSYDYLFDTKERRMRLEIDYWQGYHSKELRQYRMIWLYTPTSMQRFKFDAQGNAVGGVPAIVELPMDGRNAFLDAALRSSPPAWAVGFTPTCGLARKQVHASEFRFEKPQNGVVTATTVNDDLETKYFLLPDQDWSVQTAFDVRDNEHYSVTSEKLPQGWYPTSWQAEHGDRLTCRATWEFLDDVDASLWEEPEGIREPGKIVFTEHGRRKLDHDLSLIPPDAYREQKTDWWLRVLIGMGVLAGSYFFWRRRRDSA